MFKLTKSFRFEASHQLPSHDGKCARLHGHSWVMELVLEARDVQTYGPQIGMVIDYGRVKEAVQPLIESHLDHWHLNNTTGLANPTSEELARWVYNHVKDKLPCLAAVIIHETCTARCEYWPDPPELPDYEA